MLSRATLGRRISLEAIIHQPANRGCCALSVCPIDNHHDEDVLEGRMNIPVVGFSGKISCRGSSVMH